MSELAAIINVHLKYLRSAAENLEDTDPGKKDVECAVDRIQEEMNAFAAQKPKKALRSKKPRQKKKKSDANPSAPKRKKTA